MAISPATRHLLSQSVIRAQLGVYTLARLGSGMTILALLLTAHAALHTYSLAGLVSGAYGIGVAVGVPVSGRLADRRGVRVALPAAAVLNAAGLAVVLLDARFAVLVVGAALAGLGLPPTPACLRAGWRRLPDEQRSALFALDGIVLEAAQLVGPLVVGFLAAAVAPRFTLFIAAITTAGAALLAAASDGERPSTGPSPAGRTGPLRVPEVRLLLVLLALLTGALGLVEIAAVAFGTAHGSPARSGLLLAAMCAGSIGGGLALTLRPAPVTTAVLVRRSVGAAVGIALLPLAGDSFPLLLTLMIVGNVAIAPLFATTLTLLSDFSPTGQVTETFAWISTANYVTTAIGTALGGGLLARLTHREVFAIAAGVLVVGVVPALQLARRTTTTTQIAAPAELLDETL